MDAVMRNQENLSNKSLSKRDYDKDPIIIENNAILINFIALIIGVFFIAFAFIFFKFNESVNSSFGSLTGLVAVLTAFFNRKSSKIIIKDKHIKFIDKNLEKEIIINKHLKIYQTTDTRTTSIKKDEDGFYIVMAIAIFWALIVLVTNRTYGLFFIIFFIFMIYTILYLPSLIFQILTNKSVKNLKFYGNILIWKFKFVQEYEYINILPSYKQRLEVRDYFLEKLEIDVDKTPKIKNIFKI